LNNPSSNHQSSSEILEPASENINGIMRSLVIAAFVVVALFAVSEAAPKNQCSVSC